MKLSLSRLVDLHRGIQVLDAGHEITVDGKSARRPYRYGATVHFPLQQNALALMPHVQAWEKANAAIFKQHAEPYTDDKGAPQQRVPADRLALFKEQAEALLDTVVTVKLYRIKASELKRGTGEGENPIPIQAMTWLAPILNDDQPRDALEEATDEPAAEAKA